MNLQDSQRLLSRARVDRETTMRRATLGDFDAVLEVVQDSTRRM